MLLQLQQEWNTATSLVATWQNRFVSTAQVCGKTTFAFSDAIRRATAHLRKTGLSHQIGNLPDTYPQNQVEQIDVAVKTKILKAHLEDTFPQNRFSVKITHRKKQSTISITHDSLEKETVAEITQMYADSTVKIRLNTFVPYIGEP